jgi:two-component system cell cycle sensor histidine kinase/response regulator CckA
MKLARGFGRERPLPKRHVEAQLGRDLAAPLLKRVLLTIVFAGLLLSVASAAADFRKTLILAIGNALIATAMLPVARRGCSQTASVVVILALVVTTVYAMSTGNGLLDDSLLIIPGIFLMASLLLSTNWLVAVIVIAMIAVVGTGLAEIHGYLVTKVPIRIQYHDVVEIVILLGALAAFVHYLVAMLRRIVVEARLAHESVRDILDATSEAIFIHDASDGRILAVNEPTLKMYGAARESFLGLTPDSLKDCPAPFDGAKAADYIKRAVNEGPQAFEWLARRHDGSTFWVEVALRSARIAEETRVVAVVRDITERRRLEQRVREAETFRAVGQLAGGVAHDFNNQLVGILGHAEFLQDALSQNAELRDCAESILVSGRRAAELTHQLLAFARKGRRRIVPVDLHELIAEVIALGKRSIDKRIAIEQKLSPERAVTLGDPSALQNALLNLLLNARDAMPKGGVVRFTTEIIEVASEDLELYPTLSPGRHIALSVTDSGIGVPPENTEKIFEPFFTTKESGTGMGLAAVQGTALEHQGSISVKSEAGQGTTFRLMLPLSETSPNVELAQLTPAESPASGKVLVVDDEITVASVVGRTLTRGGYDVELCHSGQGALDRYQPNTFDLVLLDVMMPDLDGVEVLRQIRTKVPTAKVMLMSGHASESVETRLREFSDVVVLSKPFQPKQLIEEVKRVIAG